MEIKLKANAKINLWLDITGKNDNNYHNITSIMQSVNLYDTVDVELIGGEGIDVKCNAPQVPDGECNIAYKAAELFLKESHSKYKVNINIDKRIPVQAGLGGGSADAAAVLYGMNQLLLNPFSTEKLCKIGVNLGADVPFCLTGGIKLCKGIGDIISDINAPPQGYFIVIKPAYGIDTKSAYEAYDSAGIKPGTGFNEIMIALQMENAKSVGNFMYNAFDFIGGDDFEQIKQKLVRNGALGVVTAGSGSAVIGLYPDMESALTAFDGIREPVKFIAGATDKGIEKINI